MGTDAMPITSTTELNVPVIVAQTPNIIFPVTPVNRVAKGNGKKPRSRRKKRKLDTDSDDS